MKKLRRKIGTRVGVSHLNQNDLREELRAQLLRAQQDAISSGEVWDEAGEIAAELRIDRLKAELGEPGPGILEDHPPFG